MKLALGAAQFGLAYGISNRSGMTTPSELKEILSAAKEGGIDLIDTAPAYGGSEKAIGSAIDFVDTFKIVTKTSSPAEIFSIGPTLERSLECLKIQRAYGLLFHRAEDLLGPSGGALMDEALRQRDAGKVTKIGVSVYSAEEIDGVFSKFSLDLVQVPFSVLDQRLHESGHLKRLKSAGVEIHCRSVFLQGLLLMAPESLDPYFDAVRQHIIGFRSAIRKMNLEPAAACLRFALETPEIDKVICGVENQRQLNELLTIANGLASIRMENFREFAWRDPEILNPALWSLKGKQK